jgi:hypothetical protein
MACVLRKWSLRQSFKQNLKGRKDWMTQAEEAQDLAQRAPKARAILGKYYAIK